MGSRSRKRTCSRCTNTRAILARPGFQQLGLSLRLHARRAEVAFLDEWRLDLPSPGERVADRLLERPEADAGVVRAHDQTGPNDRGLGPDLGQLALAGGLQLGVLLFDLLARRLVLEDRRRLVEARFVRLAVDRDRGHVDVVPGRVAQQL